MPGLVGLLTPKYDKTIAQNIAAMTESLCHEAFYKKDIFDNPSFPFVACRVHLNILNKEPQPVCNEDATILIMMDGEINDHDSLKERLRLAGHSIKTDSDPELLLHLYEEKGEDFANELNGYFLALIHDIRQEKTLIVNDCFGFYRAFYAERDGTFIIASEIKSILKYKHLSFHANQEKFCEYFLYDAVLGDETLFEEIHRLPPASIWTYRHGAVSRRQYFNPLKLREENSLSKEEFYEEANRIFQKIIPRYISGKDVSLSLTAGWDTRAILAAMSKLGYSMSCFTWCGVYGSSCDVRVARKLSELLGLEHHVIYIGKEFFENFSDYANKAIYISDGSANVFMHTHALYLHGLARNLASIILTGKYGSEILARDFHTLKGKIDTRIFSEELLSCVSDMEPYNEPSYTNALRWFWPSAHWALQNSQLVVRMPFIDKELALFFLRAPENYGQGYRVQKYIVCKNHPLLANIVTDKGHYIRSESAIKNMKLGIQSLMIRSANTLEKGYLYRDLPNIFVRFDPVMRLTGLEKVILGFNSLPCYRRWVKNELRNFTKTMLLDERTLSRPYYNREFINKMVSDHFSSRANYHREISKIISFEIWHRLFVD